MAKTRRLLIVGETALAKVAYEYFSCDSGYEVAGFSVESQYKRNERLFDLPVTSLESVEATFSPATHDFFVAIAFSKLNRVRTRIYRDLKRRGYSAARYISSRAFLSPSAQIGEHCFIFQNVNVEPFSAIADNCLLWSGTTIADHASIADNCFVSTQVCVCASARIGTFTFLGANATIFDEVKVGRDNFIGAGAVVRRDTREGSIVRSPDSVVLAKSSLDYFGVTE